jgi:prevent-host-death family protein
MSRHATIKASEGHRTFGKLLRRVYGSDEHLIVERDGFRVAVLMSYQEYEALQRRRALDALQELNQTLSREAAQQDLSEEELQRELKQTRRELVKERYGELG